LRKVWRGAFWSIVLVLPVTVLSQAATESPVKVEPPTAATAKATAAPPTSAKQQTPTIGKQVSGRPTDSAQDTDSFWIESIDFDGDGNVESADVLWDDENKVLFLHDEGPFTCQSGGQGNGEMLMAVYGNDNARKQPAGSGWYVVGLDAGECGAKAAGLFGCRFDAKGNPTSCGAAIVQADDVTISPAK
jgi:hypothetical protein